MTKKAKPTTPIDRSFFDDHTEFFDENDPRFISLRKYNKRQKEAKLSGEETND